MDNGRIIAFADTMPRVPKKKRWHNLEAGNLNRGRGSGAIDYTVEDLRCHLATVSRRVTEHDAGYSY
jgi:hypothetical protein